MVTQRTLDRSLQAISREVWAIVYAYDPPKTPRSLWYDRWRYDVINDFVEAVSFLGAEPFIVEVDSFVNSSKLKAREFDFVINLNSGATPISNLGLVPSVAEWHCVPCFPNSADVILSGERKDICKSFFSSWFNVPRAIGLDEAKSGKVEFIVKPKTMGNSQRVTKNQLPTLAPTKRARSQFVRNIIIEEFITGYEVTIPVLFDAATFDYAVLPPILYRPHVPDPVNWFLSYELKMDPNDRPERLISKLSRDSIEALRSSSRAFNFQTLARFDFRWRVNNPNADEIKLKDLWFLEINCLPTLRTDVNFLKSVRHHIGERSDPISKHVGRARSSDIAALAYVLLQAYFATVRTR